MEHIILTLGTITRAIAARRLLATAGIPCRLLKTTDGGLAGGCSYGLKIYESDLRQASRLLEEGGIPFEWKRERGG